jgi:hypothetical protein
MNTVIITTPDAPHPKARVHSINLDAGSIAFSWLDEQDTPVDSGNSVAQLDTSAGTWPTTAQIRAALTASTD